VAVQATSVESKRICARFECKSRIARYRTADKELHGAKPEPGWA
jgi:hypothetical protein